MPPRASDGAEERRNLDALQAMVENTAERPGQLRAAERDRRKSAQATRSRSIAAAPSFHIGISRHLRCSWPVQSPQTGRRGPDRHCSSVPVRTVQYQSFKCQRHISSFGFGGKHEAPWQRGSWGRVAPSVSTKSMRITPKWKFPRARTCIERNELRLTGGTFFGMPT